MERLYIRGRILEALEERARADNEGSNPAFSVDSDVLADLVEEEFGVSIPQEFLPDVLTVSWLVDVVEELLEGDTLVM